MKATQYAGSWAPESAESRGIPQPRSTGARSSANAEAPKAADRKPASVTPIWTAARKRFGSACSSATFWPRRPRWAIDLTWPSRSETSAISLPAKKAPRRRKKPTSRALSNVPFTACASQGVRVGTPVWSSRPWGKRRRTGPADQPPRLRRASARLGTVTACDGRARGWPTGVSCSTTTARRLPRRPTAASSSTRVGSSRRPPPRRSGTTPSSTNGSRSPRTGRAAPTCRRPTSARCARRETEGRRRFRPRTTTWWSSRTGSPPWPRGPTPASRQPTNGARDSGAARWSASPATTTPR